MVYSPTHTYTYTTHVRTRHVVAYTRTHTHPYSHTQSQDRPSSHGLGPSQGQPHTLHAQLSAVKFRVRLRCDPLPPPHTSDTHILDLRCSDDTPVKSFHVEGCIVKVDDLSLSIIPRVSSKNIYIYKNINYYHSV